MGEISKLPDVLLIDGFEQHSGGRSGWSLRITREQRIQVAQERVNVTVNAVVDLYWTDKDTPTHRALIPLDIFKKMVADL